MQIEIPVPDPQVVTAHPATAVLLVTAVVLTVAWAYGRWPARFDAWMSTIRTAAARFFIGRAAAILGPALCMYGWVGFSDYTRDYRDAQAALPAELRDQPRVDPTAALLQPWPGVPMFVGLMTASIASLIVTVYHVDMLTDRNKL